MSRIKITAQPANLSYTSGQALDLSGLSVQVYYNDNTNETLTWASGKLTAAPAQGTVLTVAEHNGKTVTISYGGKTAQTDVLTVGKAAQAALFITGAPSPIYEGSSFTLPNLWRLRHRSSHLVGSQRSRNGGCKRQRDGNRHRRLPY